MASPLQRSINRTSTPLPPKPGLVLIAFDATKSLEVLDFKHIIQNVLTWGTMIQGVNNIKVFGVLQKILHPLGFQIKIGPESFVGAHSRAIKEEVSRKVDAYAGMLQQIYEQCEGVGVDLEVKVAVGAPMTKVVVQEVVDLDASWAVLDRQLRKELRFYLDHIPCKVAHVRDDLSLHVLRPYNARKITDSMKHKLLYSLSKPVSPLPSQDNGSEQQSVLTLSTGSPTSSDIAKNGSMVSSTLEHEKEDNNILTDEFESNCQGEISGIETEQEKKHENSTHVMQEENVLQNHPQEPAHCTSSKHHDHSDMQTAPDERSFELGTKEGIKRTSEMTSDTCTGDEMNSTSFDSLGCSYSVVLTATDNFSSDNILGEGKNGVVYKGQLKDGRFVAVKVLKRETRKEGYLELHSEVNALILARHTHVVTLLGFCCNEYVSVLMYEYICNKSLEWHLFDNTERVLEWHRRQVIAIGAAKGLRFLHEECRGGPIVHRDMRPSNILLTHDYVPMLGDFGLAKWKENEIDVQKRIIGSLGYLAPEYAETGICSPKIDVYSFGIVLLQLISGRKAESLIQGNEHQSIRDWALPLIHRLELNELVDPRLGDLYSTYEVYNMTRAANLCLQSKPSMRPTMGEVLHLLEGTNDHLRHVKSNLYPPMISLFT